MGLMDTLKKTAAQATEMAGDLADQHGDKVKGAIDKAATTADEQTKGKYAGKIGTGAGKAKEAIDKLGKKGK